MLRSPDADSEVVTHTDECFGVARVEGDAVDHFAVSIFVEKNVVMAIPQARHAVLRPTNEER